jgi:hypothetical protein
MTTYAVPSEPSTRRPDLLGKAAGNVVYAGGSGRGVVEKVLLDDEGEPTALALRLGFLETRHVVVALAAVAAHDAAARHVFLRADWRDHLLPGPWQREAEGAPISCSLAYALDRLEPCPGSQCAFWDTTAGGEGCAFAAVEAELRREPAVARMLLRKRRELEAARPSAA